MQIALIDCNNFYASCEAEFQPKLSGLALVVLSNNDGCVVARSPQAKAAGIRMGEPMFKIKHLIQQQNIQVFSSNYALYGDMSQRVMIALSQFTPEIEIYSIDEAFLDLSGFEHRDLAKYGQEIRDRVKQWTGISVSIGIAPTKTLAKVANRVAKKSGSGVCHLVKVNVDEVLSVFHIENIWGISRRYAITGILHSDGLCPSAQGYRSSMGKAAVQRRDAAHHPRVTGSFLYPDGAPPSRQSIMVSRSFGRPVMGLKELNEVIANFLSQAEEKLRLYQMNLHH